ncbi:hypothetical protein [Kitasatospora putterlickiae]|uniref:hypothetical protein n=1 Tax=Kitasatospora putterlickiae TaxID=221725 RepID=UPI0031DC316F
MVTYAQANPTNPATWQDQDVSFDTTASGFTPSGPPGPTVLVTAAGARVGGLVGIARCGSAVTATFSLDQPGWPPSTSTVSAFVNC